MTGLPSLYSFAVNETDFWTFTRSPTGFLMTSSSSSSTSSTSSNSSSSSSSTSSLAPDPVQQLPVIKAPFLLLPSTLQCNIWTFIPREWFLSRCLHTSCLQLDPSKELQSIVYKELICPQSYEDWGPDNLWQVPFSTMKSSTLRPCLFPSWTSVIYREFMNKISNRIASAFEIRLCATTLLAKLFWISLWVNGKHSNAFHLIALPIIHVLHNSEVEDIEIPPLDVRAHEQLARALWYRGLVASKETGSVKTRSLKLSGKLTLEIMTLWSDPCFGWKRMNVRNCELTNQLVEILLSKNTSLHVLNAEKNLLTDDCVPLIVKWIENQTGYGKLVLAANSFTADGQAQLLQAVRSNSNADFILELWTA